MPVKVATVESIAIVTAPDPLNEVPLKPVPIVNALVVLAVMVILAEPLNETPFIVLAVCKVVAVEALPDKAPAKVVAVNAFVLALYVNPESINGDWFPVD